MEYRVSYEYRGTVEVFVDAENVEEAMNKGIEEADEAILNNLHVYDIRAKAAKKRPS